MLPADVIPEALSPEYVCAVDEPILLYQGEGILWADRKEHRGQCLIRYSWHPNRGAEVFFPIAGRGFFHGFHGDVTLEVPAIGLKTPVLCRLSTGGTHGASFTGMINGEARMGQGTGLARMSFHIANFPFVFGAKVKRGTRQMWARIHLECDSWAIDIDPVPDERESGEPDLPHRISEARGYAITHTGSITRNDGGTFDVSDADEILHDVSRTLSFARAALSNPFLRSGYDAAGVKIWQCWSSFPTDAWNGHVNWFSQRHPQSLQSVFAGWRQLAKSPSLEVVSAAAHLYNDSHAPGLAVESRLVLAQAALEGLADGWSYPPMSGSSVVPKFESGAAARVAQISASLGLPFVVPASLPALSVLTKPNASAPALDKMTWVRNSIAHLDNFPRLAAQSPSVRDEAYQLAAWYLELALLKLLGASGPYLNRLTAQTYGDEEQLPWLHQGP